jgi:methionyl-tRNA formyltransferase
MRIIFMGTPDFAVPALKRIHEVHDVAAVYTQPPRPAGRGQRTRPSPVQVFAVSHRLEVCSPKSLKFQDVQTEFSAWKADVAVVAAYGLILPQFILDAPRLGCVNIHASLLPRWRGAAPIQRAIMAGDEVTGITIMQMDAGLDTGAVLLKDEVSIGTATTAGDLHDRLAEVGGTLVLKALAGLAEGNFSPAPQPVEGATYAAKIEKAEARIEFGRPAVEVLRHIHGLSPSPGAWFESNNERIKILTAELNVASGLPGTVLDDQLTIACSENSIRAITVQRAGKAPAEAASFLRGFALPKGTLVA